MQPKPTVDRLEVGWARGDWAVDRVVEIRDTVTVVSGPNGSGKTSMFKIAQTTCSQYAPVNRTEGRVRLRYSDGSAARVVYGVNFANYELSDGEAMPRELHFDLDGPGTRQFGTAYTNPEKVSQGRGPAQLKRLMPTRRCWQAREDDSVLDTLDAAFAFGQFETEPSQWKRLAHSHQTEDESQQWLEFLGNRQPIRFLSTERLGELSIVSVCASELDLLFALEASLRKPSPDQEAFNQVADELRKLNPEIIITPPTEGERPDLELTLARAQVFMDLTNRYLESCGFVIRALSEPADEKEGAPDFRYFRLYHPQRPGARVFTALPSGARHIFVLFYAVLMHFPPGSLIFIDEPELSLHIGWQYALLSDLALAAKHVGSRVVVATHSPAIVNDWWGNVVELE